MADGSSFVEGMRLTSREIDVLDKYVGMIEQATKSRVDFANSGQVAFTPGALLAVAVARFAYQVYRDYGSVALSPEEIQAEFKTIARELAELEAGGPEAMNLDTYARFRKDLMSSRKRG